MSSFIRYKLRNFLEDTVLEIEARTILCADLKEKLHVAMGISKERFDLNLLNSYTKTIIPEEEIVHHASSVLVQRVPVYGRRLPKTTTRANFIAPPKEAAEQKAVPSAEWSAMTEEDRIKAVIKQSTQYTVDKTAQSTNSRGRKLPQGNPPPGYACRICNKSGHWIQLCPLKKFKKANGLLASELMPATKDDPLAMITNDGRYVKKIAEQRMLDEQKTRKRAFSEDSKSSSATKKSRV